MFEVGDARVRAAGLRLGMMLRGAIKRDWAEIAFLSAVWFFCAVAFATMFVYALVFVVRS